jgi:hypothetical protein
MANDHNSGLSGPLSKEPVMQQNQSNPNAANGSYRRFETFLQALLQALAALSV